MSDYLAELQALVGTEGPVETGPFEVNKHMIALWCEAMEDKNPAYLNEEYANRSRRGGIIAPFTMIQAWSMPLLNPGQTRRWYPEPGEEPDFRDPQLKVFDILEKAGYPGVVATTTSIDVVKPLRLGDRITLRKEFSGFTPEKVTKAGIGHFVTFLRTYTNQDGELVAKQTFTMLIFKNARN